MSYWLALQHLPVLGKIALAGLGGMSGFGVWKLVEVILTSRYRNRHDQIRELARYRQDLREDLRFFKEKLHEATIDLLRSEKKSLEYLKELSSIKIENEQLRKDLDATRRQLGDAQARLEEAKGHINELLTHVNNLESKFLGKKP